jgi:hypothetical protein
MPPNQNPEQIAHDAVDTQLRYIQPSARPLPFLYEATAVFTGFTDQRDPKSRSRDFFTFYRPEIERNERESDRAFRKSTVLRQTIQKKAFTGRLVPRSPANERAAQLFARPRAEQPVSRAGENRF